jgi:hypothetical protein
MMLYFTELKSLPAQLYLGIFAVEVDNRSVRIILRDIASSIYLRLHSVTDSQQPLRGFNEDRGGSRLII